MIQLKEWPLQYVFQPGACNNPIWGIIQVTLAYVNIQVASGLNNVTAVYDNHFGHH